MKHLILSSASACGVFPVKSLVEVMKVCILVDK